MQKEFIKNIKNDQSGNALLMVMVLFVVISLSVAIGLITPVLRANRVATNNLESKKSYFVAESGIEDVYYRLLNSKNVSSSETLVLGEQVTTTTLTDIVGGGKQLQSVGNSDERNRTVSVALSEGAGVSFNYGVQVGAGGMKLSGSSSINGSVYANGDIEGSSSSFITGSAFAANGSASATDQQNDSGTVSDIVFGKTSNFQDIAQSFVLSSVAPLNKVQLYIKKVGTPSNATIYIMNDKNGAPGTSVLAQAPLSASLVGTSMGWVEVLFTTNPTLGKNIKYWIVIDGSASSSKYYVAGSNNDGYKDGEALIGKRGGSWSNVAPAANDLYFRVFLGGESGRISSSGGSQWNQFRIGNSIDATVSAEVVDYISTVGTLNCQSGTGNNKACNPLPTPPAPQALPVSDSNIASWKDEALTGGTINGNANYAGSSTATLGPKKIDGNLTIGASAQVTLTGTVWVTGDLIVNGAGKLKLSSAYGTGSGVVVVDGKITVAGSSPVSGSGTAGSYIMLVSLSDCPISPSCSGKNAIDISGAAGAVALVAQNGTIEFSGSASAKQATGYAIVLSGATTVNYESGLANMNFSSGPSGSWNIKSWREVQ